jgi:beta-galactosidase
MRLNVFASIKQFNFIKYLMNQKRSKVKCIAYVFVLLLASAAHAQQKIRLNNGWQFLKQDLGGVWESVRDIGKSNPGSVPMWDSVTLPHCYNARDAVDPDVAYYQGPAWYRTLLDVRNP